MQDSSVRLRSEIQRLAAEFINRESNRLSLITVTGVFLTDDQKKATIFCSVYPKDKEVPALEFLKRNRGEMRAYLKKHGALHALPFLEVALTPELPDIA